MVNLKKNKTTLLLIRHGQSTWNLERRIQGQLDPELTQSGLEQADIVAQRLQGQSWDALYSSDLSRTSQTAAPIAKVLGLEVKYDPLLREWRQGKREGLLAVDAEERYPDPDAPEVGRESPAELRDRGSHIYEKIRDSHPGQRVVVVGHGGIMRVFIRTALGDDQFAVIKNTSCTLMHWDGEKWELEYYNDDSHLDSYTPAIPTITPLSPKTGTTVHC